VSYSVIVSSGLLLATLGVGDEALTPPALFYFATSVLSTSAFFMLTGMTDRTRVAAEVPPVASEAPPVAAEPPAAVRAAATPAYVAFGVREPQEYDTSEEVGAAIPAAMAFLGLMFVCCVLLITGMPPLPSFVAKFALLSAALDTAHGAEAPIEKWVLVAGILVSGLAQMIALTRVGIRLFWGGARRTPRLRVLEAAPVAAIVLLSLLLSAMSGTAMGFFEAAASSLHAPEVYTRIVLSAPGADQPSAGDPR
jgi:multicomponent K+:H+ antiporter subunit D